MNNIAVLHSEFMKALGGYTFELIYINDGSIDATYSEIKSAVMVSPPPYGKIIDYPHNRGQSFAFKVGLEHSRFDTIVFLDGDLQNDPKDIPRLLDKMREGYDLVQGIRSKRKDSFFSKVFPSLIANLLLRVFCGSMFTDIGCSLKVFRKNLALEMVFQQGIHRMLPIYFCLKGAKVTEVAVNHRKRIYGKTKYGFSRVIEVLFEIVKINFFEKDSNGFLMLTIFLSFLIIFCGLAMAIFHLSGRIGEVITYLILSTLGFYIFIIGTILYILRSFYVYYKNIPKQEDIRIEIYGRERI
jgi:dolichol-phosphate mannosyltransferase